MTTRTSSCNCGQLSLTYDGPDPERISLCQCYECQRRTGSVFSVQARLPIEHVTIEGPSTTWTFPTEGGKPATFRSCDSMGATYHFCPACGSTVYWELSLIHISEPTRLLSISYAVFCLKKKKKKKKRI